jgi:hypothetical protein
MFTSLTHRFRIFKVDQSGASFWNIHLLTNPTHPSNCGVVFQVELGRRVNKTIMDILNPLGLASPWVR